MDERPKQKWLRRIHECEDEKVLKYLLKDFENLKIDKSKNELELLWECCQIPDFAKKT